MAQLFERVGAVLFPALVALALAACTAAASGPAQPPAPAPALTRAQAAVAAQVAPAAVDARAATAQVVVPVALAVREQAEALLLPAPSGAPVGWAGAPAAADLITRWEVTSPQVYARKWQGVACPGGASGPTVGIGYDLGHATAAAIARDWAAHPAAARLATGSGQVGAGACRAWRAANADLRVPYPLAVAVFRQVSLPAYTLAAERALGDGWDALPLHAQAADVSLGYNRGWSMRGERNREKRAIRDTCAPGGDAPCNAAQLRAMCRLWAGTALAAGLCGRRHDEARVALLP